MSEKELLENILTADILILGKVIEAEKRTKGTHSSSGTSYAIEAIRENRHELIAKLLAKN